MTGTAPSPMGAIETAFAELAAETHRAAASTMPR